jgi:hypothetical protein
VGCRHLPRSPDSHHCIWRPCGKRHVRHVSCNKSDLRAVYALNLVDMPSRCGYSVIAIVCCTVVHAPSCQLATSRVSVLLQGPYSGLTSDRRCWRLQVGNQAFAFAFQQLLDLSYLWSTSTHLNVTNATLASGAVPADEVRVLNDTRTVVSGRKSCRVLAVGGMLFSPSRHKSRLRICSPSRCAVSWHGCRVAG